MSKTKIINITSITGFLVYLVAFIYKYGYAMEKNFLNFIGILGLSLLFMTGIKGVLTGKLWIMSFPWGKPFSRIIGLFQILFALWFLLYL